MNAKWLLHWAPFRIDALGLVTLLGAHEINQTIGRLCTSQVTEFLPLVAGHVIADDSIKHPIPGFAVYNITDGICATDVTGWFSRWILCQQLTYSATTLTIGVLPSKTSRKSRLHWAACLGFVVSLSMLLLALIISDWWASANAISLAISVIARFRILKESRDAVDRAAERGAKQSSTMVKTFWKLPDGSHLVIYTSRGILTECLLTTPKPQNPKAYGIYKCFAWAAFLVHVLSLGMAALPSQLLCIVILAASTVCTISRLGSDDQLVGTRLHICRFDRRDKGSSVAAMLTSLRLSREEEECMVDWRIMPMPKNRIWWQKYKDCIAQNSLAGFDDWKNKETWAKYENQPWPGSSCVNRETGR